MAGVVSGSRRFADREGFEERRHHESTEVFGLLSARVAEEAETRAVGVHEPVDDVQRLQGAADDRDEPAKIDLFAPRFMHLSSLGSPRPTVAVDDPAGIVIH